VTEVVDINGRAGMVRFTSESARAAALRSAEVRRAKRAHKQATAAGTARELALLAQAHERGDLGGIAMAAAAELIGRVVRGDVPVRNGDEAAGLLRALVDIGRLESGDPTRTVAVAHLSGPALAQRLRELQRSSAVQAADDDVDPVPPHVHAAGGVRVGESAIPPDARPGGDPPPPPGHAPTRS
jgi:hypothetical protein